MSTQPTPVRVAVTRVMLDIIRDSIHREAGDVWDRRAEHFDEVNPEIAEACRAKAAAIQSGFYDDGGDIGC